MQIKKDERNEIKSTSHSRYRCQYHIVFAPKYRRKEIYGQLKKDIGEILRTLCKQKNVEICHHLSFLLNVITAWHIKPNTREKQPPPNSDAPHPAPDIVIKPPTKKIPMPRNIPTP